MSEFQQAALDAVNTAVSIAAVYGAVVVALLTAITVRALRS